LTLLRFEDRPSSSPYIERVWRSHSTADGQFHSLAEANIELVVMKVAGRTSVILRGPVTKPNAINCPPDGEWFAIRLRAGTHLPRVPTAGLMNGNNLVLGEDCSGQFHLDGARWEIPSFDNAEDLVLRLVREGVLARDGAVAAAVDGDPQALSQRSVQRRFVRTLGLSYSHYRQIERARRAVRMLRSGTPVADIVHGVGYFDQSHLIHALRRLSGLTPKEIVRPETQLSFLYNTKIASGDRTSAL
jgi:hypothetical protein